jgi:hypothetical protein
VALQDTASVPQPKPKTRIARERRAHRRKPTLWEGRLDTDVGVFPCLILNVSQGGALVQVEAPLLPTERASLTIERFGSLGAQVVWQIVELCKIGVRFTDPPQHVARVLNGALPL